MSRNPLRLAILVATVVWAALAPAAATAQSVYETVMIACAVNDPANTEYTQDAADRATPELPVVLEEEGGITPHSGQP